MFKYRIPFDKCEVWVHIYLLNVSSSSVCSYLTQQSHSQHQVTGFAAEIVHTN